MTQKIKLHASHLPDDCTTERFINILKGIANEVSTKDYNFTFKFDEKDVELRLSKMNKRFATFSADISNPDMFFDKFRYRRAGELTDEYITFSREDSKPHRDPDANVYVSNLSSTVLPGPLHEAISTIGKVASVYLPTHQEGKDRGKFKGFGYIQFENAKSAASALVELDGAIIEEKVIKIDKCKTRGQLHSETAGRTLYFKYLPKKVDGDESFKKFALKNGMISTQDEIEEVRSKEHTAKINGHTRKDFYFIVKFKTPDAAERALQFNGTSELKGKKLDRPLYITWMRSKKEMANQRTRQQMIQRMILSEQTQYRNVFVKGLPTCRLDDILKYIRKYGEIEKDKNQKEKVMFSTETTGADKERWIHGGVCYVLFRNSESARSFVDASLTNPFVHERQVLLADNSFKPEKVSVFLSVAFFLPRCKREAESAVREEALVELCRRISDHKKYPYRGSGKEGYEGEKERQEAIDNYVRKVTELSSDQRSVLIREPAVFEKFIDNFGFACTKSRDV